MESGNFKGASVLHRILKLHADEFFGMRPGMKEYEWTVKGVRYRLRVPANEVEAFERAKADGSWIRMVQLAEWIENADVGAVVKAPGLVFHSGRVWGKTTTHEAHEQFESSMRKKGA